MTRSPDPMHYALPRQIVSAPGTSWRYHGGTTQVLGTLVQRATKQPLAEYARTVLFSPLGITESEWLGSLAGVPSAASGLRLRPRDLAKFGSLYLHDGRWNGRQILPREWADESTCRRCPRLPRPSARPEFTMNPFIGTWIANLEKSRRHANHQFQSATLTFEVAGDAIAMTHAGVNKSGKQESGTTMVTPDGQEHPMSPQAPGVVAVTTWTGTHVLESEAKKDGRSLGKGTYAVSTDGSTLTATVAGTDAAGAAFEQVVIFDRGEPQAGCGGTV